MIYSSFRLIVLSLIKKKFFINFFKIFFSANSLI